MDISNLKITPTDPKAEEEGVWTDYRGVKLKIARLNNPKFQRAFKKFTRPYQKEMRKGTLDNDISKEILAKAMAEGLLVDWKDFVVDDQEIPYSRDAATSLLINDTDCADFVHEFASDLDNFITEAEDDLEKE